VRDHRGRAGGGSCEGGRDRSSRSELTLVRDEPLFVRIEYFADEPVSTWARPYFEGQQVRRYKSNASFRYSGAGHALGWFSLDEAAGGRDPHRPWRGTDLSRAEGRGSSAAGGPHGTSSRGASEGRFDR